MQTGYFSMALNDIRRSPGWRGTVLRLTLLNCVPVFGWIVVPGYLYGWARDIAWGMQTPLPPRIFADEDGRLYSRGFFALVIALVFSLAPLVLSWVWDSTAGAGWGMWRTWGAPLPLVGMAGCVAFALSLAMALAAASFSWVGTMRMCVYGRLAPGLQLGKIWSMIRHDLGGLLRIAAMAAVVFVLAEAVTLFVVLAGALLALFAFVGAGAAAAGPPSLEAMVAVPGAVLAMLLAGAVLFVVAMCAITFGDMLVVRAMGYWTRQFNVPLWRGQDDPMPFEVAGRPPRC